MNPSELNVTTRFNQTHMEITGPHPPIPILFEDRYLLIVDKPAGMLSQKDHTGDIDITEACKPYLAQKEGSGGYVGLLHRLDQPVSGILMLAKDPQTARALTAQMKDQRVSKEYLAVVEGKTPPNGFLEHWLRKDSRANKVSVVPQHAKGAKVAQLTFIRKAEATNRPLSLLAVHLMTGRSHQIRVQLAHEGFPIWGDQRYGRARSGNIALRASSVRFRHPQKKEELTIEAPYPTHEPWSHFQPDRKG